MEYIYITITLVITILVYFKIADKYNIIDKPNERSSHKNITIRGGGVLFPLAALLWFLFNGFSYPYIIVGVILLAIVSFVDDIKPQSRMIRFLIQFIAISLMLYQLEVFTFINVFFIAVLYIILVGFVNIVNFMDGINGITSLYSLSAIFTFLYLNQQLEFTDNDLLIYSILGLLVFTFFNFRKKAKCFAGDVGSISIAYLMLFVLIQLLIVTKNLNFLLFFSIYAIDTGVTFFQRLFKKQKVLDAHRTHLYQYLANEMKWGHLKVSVIYFIVQVAINCLVIFWVNKLNNQSILPLILITFCLILIYIVLKSIILRRINNTNHDPE